MNAPKTRSGARRARGMVTLLCLAATPTFAIMALLSASDGGASDMLCAQHGVSPLTGMTAMYLAMSAFHLPPWIKLIARRRRGHACRVEPPISMC